MKADCNRAENTEGHILRKLIITLAAAIFAVGLGIGTSEAKTFSGIWDNVSEAVSTLSFLGDGQVKYCFKSECIVAAYQGDPNKKIWFNWGRAKFYFSWDGKGYKGTRQAGSRRNRTYLQ